MDKQRLFLKQMAGCSVLPAFAFAIVPVLILRGTFPFIVPEAQPYWSGYIAGDIRSWWKAVTLIGIALWMLVQTAVRLYAGWRPRERLLPALLGLAALATLVSTLLSPYRQTSWLGYTFHYEGAFALLAYLIAIWYVAEMADSPHSRIWLLRTLGVIALINAAIGFTAGFGFYLWESEFGRWLMGVGGLSVTYNFAGSRMASGTVFQPNHYGMLMATFGVVALGMTPLERRGWRVFWAVTLTASFCAVLFSQSRAGLFVFVFMTVVYLAWQLVLYKRRSGGAVSSSRLLAYIAGFCLVLGGLAAIRDVREAFLRLAVRSASLSNPGKKDYLVKAVGLESNRIRIRLQDDAVLLLARGGGGSWAMRREAGGGVLALAASEPDAEGWLTAAIPEIDGGTLSWNRRGNVHLRAPDVDMEFFSIGTRLYVVDTHYRLYADLPLTTYEPNGYEGLFNGRGYIWRRSLEAARRNPWFGTGPGTMIMAFPNKDLLNKQRFSQGQDEDKGHGIWASFLVQLGVIGVMLYGLSAGYVIAVAVRRGGSFSALLVAGMAAYLICSLTNDSTVGVTPVYCVLAGLAVANARHAKA